jgi:hypothetical protein
MTRINVSIASHDPVLALAMAKIGDEVLVDGALGDRGVEGVVKQRLLAGAAQPGGCTLDLIAHAANGVLLFGDWSIDAEDRDQIDPRLLHSWAPRKLESIRLLGCNTAVTEAGQKAMRHLAEVFGVPIFGTTVPLFLRDFDAGGLSSRGEFTLRETPALEPVEAQVSDAAVERWFAWFDPVKGQDINEVFHRLRHETLDEATLAVRRTPPRYRWSVRRFTAEDRQRLLAQLVAKPELATAPGLLAVPDWQQRDREFEALFPAGTSLEGPPFHRATFLFGGRFVRIYPVDTPEGMILRSASVFKLAAGIDVPLPRSTT